MLRTPLAPLHENRLRRAAGALGSRSAAAARSLCSRPLRLDPALERTVSRFRAEQLGAKAGTAGLVDEFSKLQARRVKRVLLLCSDYDSYTFEEDGDLSEVVYHEYVQLNLRTPPVIERVASADKALTRLRESEFDLIVTLLKNASSFAAQATKLAPSVPIAMLAMSSTELSTLDPRVDHSQRVNVNKRLMWETGKTGENGTAIGTSSGLDDAWIWPFLWQGNTSIFTGMFKAVEDRLNAAVDTSMGVQVILLVEDSVKFYSSYLPVLYGELLKQMTSVEKETMSAKEKLMRMYSRPKVMLCTNYEEALDIYDRYSNNIIGVISDAGFPRNGLHDEVAGLSLARKILDERPDLPLLLQSASPSDSAVAKSAAELGASYACKQSASLLQTLRQFLTDDMMFGRLRFQDGKTGKVLGEVSTVTELLRTWEALPLTSVAYHARNCHLSKWFLARGEYELAARFRKSVYPNDFIDGSGHERPDWLRNWILSETRAHRNKLASGVQNSAQNDLSLPILRLGSGAVGGKGRGFRFLNSLIENNGLATLMPEMTITVPRSYVLATGIFDQFMEENELTVPALTAADDDALRALFSDAALPETVTSELHRYLSSMTKPLAVRSSSLFEDAFLRPFAGVYETLFLPNASPSIETRVQELSHAIKMVFASTYSQEALKYSESTGNRGEEEKMAVILQEVVGTEQEGFFYPTIAGVANSVDFYPPPDGEGSHGCAQVALGLGDTVVDGVPSVLNFNLGTPHLASGPEEDKLRLRALDLTVGAQVRATTAASSPMVELPADYALLRTFPRECRAEMAPEAATAVPLMHDVHGEQVVFKPGYGEASSENLFTSNRSGAMKRFSLKELITSEVPLAKALSLMLRLSSIGLGCPVELEFALKLRRSPEARHELHILQVRPQVEVSRSNAARSLRFRYLPGEDHAAVCSSRALGHGAFDNICDIVYVSPDRFDSNQTGAIAAEIAELNSSLSADGRRFLLMAPGRWGSSDPSRGIPVSWKDIDRAGFIVETTIADKPNVPLSQGSHFFQNILSFGIGYATVDPPSNAEEVADYAFWDSLPSVSDGKYARHVQLPAPLEIVVDGVSRRGVVMKPNNPFDLYVGQVDAFMALQEEQFGTMG